MATVRRDSSRDANAIRALAKLEQTLEAVVANLRVDAFVMGPHIPDEPDAKLSDDARLRKHLISRLSSIGFAVEPGLESVIAKVHGQLPKTNLASVELYWAKTVHLLIFIPSSNGSAAEVGFFAGIQTMSDARAIGEKSLILLDKSYKKTPGFVALGPSQILVDAGAKLLHVDYANLSAVWRAVNKHAGEVKRRQGQLAAARGAGL